jgi:hypothetical protein
MTTTVTRAVPVLLLAAAFTLSACSKSDKEKEEPTETASKPTVASAAPAPTPEPKAAPAATPAASLVPAATSDIPTTPVKTGGKLDLKSGKDTESFKVGAAWAIPRIAYDAKGERVSGTSYEIKIVNDQDKSAKPCGAFEILKLDGNNLGVSVSHRGGYVPGAEASFEIPGGAAFVTRITSGPQKGKPAMARTVDNTSKLTIKSVVGNVLTGSIDATGYGNAVKGDFVAQICPPN